MQCYDKVNLMISVGECDCLELHYVVAPMLVCGCSLLMRVDGIHKFRHFRNRLQPSVKQTRRQHTR